MSDIQTRLDTLSRRIQAIIDTACQAPAPITRLEAFDQIVEEMELAGYGAPTSDGLAADEIAHLRRLSAH